MDPTMKMKAFGASILLACVMVLAWSNKVDGNQALQALEALGAAWFGSIAVLGGANAVASAMVRNKELP